MISLFVVIIFILSILDIMISQLSAYESGAPCAAQYSLHPSSIYHGESQNLKSTPPPYRFSVSDADDFDVKNYAPGRAYTIRLMSMDDAHFRGFIIQPRIATKEGTLIGNLRAGHFIHDKSDFNYYGIQFQKCAPYNDDSITHKNRTVKFFLEARWTVEKNYGPIQFTLTIVQERNEFWEMWQPASGLLLPEGDQPVSPSPTSPTTEDPLLLQTQGHPLIKKLHQHQVGGSVAFDDSEDDNTETTRDAQLASSQLATETYESGEEEANEQRNQTEFIAEYSSSQNDRLPTEVDTEERKSNGEISVDEKETAVSSSSAIIANPVAKLPESGTIRKQNSGSEEASDEKNASSESQTPADVTSGTKAPFRFPLASLTRLKKLLRLGELRNSSKTDPKRTSTEEMPTPPPFTVSKNNSETTRDAQLASRIPKQDYSTEEMPTPPPFNEDVLLGSTATEEAEEISPSPSRTSPRTLATWPVENRLEFPTLSQFPLGNKAANENRQEEDDGNRTLVRFSLPAKPGDKVDPVIKLLNAATVPPEESDGAIELENEKNLEPKASNSSDLGKSGVADGKTTSEEVSSADEDDSSKLGSAEENLSVPIGEKSQEDKRTQGQQEDSSKEEVTVENLPPAAPVLIEEEDSVNASRSRGSTKKGDGRFSNATIPLRREGLNGTLDTDAALLKENDFCASFPCYNKATCVSVAGEKQFECKCSDGWTGPVCDIVNFCGKKNPCRNGGVCVNGDFNYTCNCTGSHVGKHCDNKCPPTLCKNGGTCTLEEHGGYICQCRPGYNGAQCEKNIDDCASSPCLNGATCVDRVNAFFCQCQDGYMGERCHRPCQNIYRSCQLWGEEGRCESTRRTTRWFDVNCGSTCGLCVFNNTTVNTLMPLPPALEPLHFLIGKWNVNTTHLNRFPIDFVHGNAGYYEEIEFVPTQVPMFGTPSINYTAIARNSHYPEDVLVSHGFLTLKPNSSPTKVALMSTGNDGITLLEEGVLTSDATLEMKVEYMAVVPAVLHKAPTLAKRQFTLYDGFLRETVERQLTTGPTEYFTKYFYKGVDYTIY